MRNLIRRFFSAIADGIGSGISTMATTGKKKYLNLEGLTYLCSKIKDALTLKLDKSQIVQNATTAATDKVPSADVAKNLQDQITQLNTKTDYANGIQVTEPSYISIGNRKAELNNGRVVIMLMGTALFSNAGSQTISGISIPEAIRPPFTVGFSGRGYYVNGSRIVPFSGTLTSAGVITFECTETLNLNYQLAFCYDI